jgi:hypothetical protein
VTNAPGLLPVQACTSLTLMPMRVNSSSDTRLAKISKNLRYRLLKSNGHTSRRFRVDQKGWDANGLGTPYVGDRIVADHPHACWLAHRLHSVLKDFWVRLLPANHGGGEDRVDMLSEVELIHESVQLRHMIAQYGVAPSRIGHRPQGCLSFRENRPLFGRGVTVPKQPRSLLSPHRSHARAAEGSYKDDLQLGPPRVCVDQMFVTPVMLVPGKSWPEEGQDVITPNIQPLTTHFDQTLKQTGTPRSRALGQGAVEIPENNRC